jgi:hypothetical protein
VLLLLLLATESTHWQHGISPISRIGAPAVAAAAAAAVCGGTWSWKKVLTKERMSGR